MRRALVAVLLVAPVLVPTATATHDPATVPLIRGDAPLDRAMDWWVVNETGCPNPPHDPCGPYWAKWLTVTAAHTGYDPAAWPSQDAAVLDWLLDHADGLEEGKEEDYCSGSGDSDDCRFARTMGRTKSILAFEAAGLDAREVPLPDGGTRDFVAELLDQHDGNQFGRSDLVNDDVWAIVGLNAAGYDGPEVASAADYVESAQGPNGGLGHSHGSSATPTVDDTAAAVMALAPRGREAFVDDALGYLEEMQFTDGEHRACWPLRSQAAGSPDPTAPSTAWTIQALVAAGEDPLAWSVDGRSPVDCLLSFQQSDGGFEHNPDEDDDPDENNSSPLPTQQATVALAWAPYGSVGEPTSTFQVQQTATRGEETTTRVPDGFLRLDRERVETHRWTPEETGEVVFHGYTSEPHVRPATVTVDVRAPDSGSSSSGSSGGSGGTSNTGDGTPPSIDLPGTIPAERNVSRSTTIDATPADDPVVELKVDWGDGDATSWQASADFAHTYTALGEHTLTAWARDADGDVGRSSTTVEVVDAAPRIEIDGPASVNRTEPANLTAAVHDPDGPTPEVRWSAGDRTAEGPAASFRFQAAGEHRVEAVATDQAANTAQATHTIEALNRAPEKPTVRPAEVPANESVVLRANASDPDGDRLAFAWTPPGAGQPSAWGSQLHLDTGSPGTVELTVNASDGRGGWTTARVEVTVTETRDDRGDEAAERIETSSSDQPPADDPPAPAAPSPTPPAVDLPGSLTVRSDRTTLLSGTAHDPDGTVDRVVVELGGRLPVQGTSDFTARVPALPPGTYTLQAYAIDRAGHAGPPANLTLEVHAPPADEPVTATSGPEPADVPIPTGAALVALVGAGLAARRLGT